MPKSSDNKFCLKFYNSIFGIRDFMFESIEVCTGFLLAGPETFIFFNSEGKVRKQRKSGIFF